MVEAMSSYRALALARTVALLSDWLRPCTTSVLVLKLSPSTAQFMPRKWRVAAWAGDVTTTRLASAASAVATRAMSNLRNDRVLRGGPDAYLSDDKTLAMTYPIAKFTPLGST